MRLTGFTGLKNAGSLALWSAAVLRRFPTISSATKHVSYETYRTYLETRPVEVAANILLCPSSAAARKNFPDTRNRRPPDCEHQVTSRKIKRMTLVRVELTDLARLHTLRQLDQFRNWSALDDQRFCLVCGKLISGREILILNDGTQTGTHHLHCPTSGCNSIPMDWVVPTREILAILSMRKGRHCSKRTHETSEIAKDGASGFSLEAEPDFGPIVRSSLSLKVQF